MSNDSKARFKDPDLWIRLVYMILFGLVAGIARLVLYVIALLQFLSVLFTGEDNARLRGFAATLAEWNLRVFRFLCFNTEQKPFPFEDWPTVDEPAGTAAEEESPAPAAAETVTPEEPASWEPDSDVIALGESSDEPPQGGDGDQTRP